MRKHIYIAYTGGTIGMKPSENGYIPAKGFLANTLKNMPEFHREEMPRFTLHEYEHLIDSSNMSPEDWLFIAKDIQQHYHEYDGFIILHGTDTMSFTASALSFMFENLAKPVIVTGSQIPFAELRSDGQENLLNALYIAANYPIAEVSLYFSNNLFRGNRSSKVDASGFNAFGSPNYPSLLEAGINIEVKAGQLISPNEYNLKNSSLTILPLQPQPIGVVTLYPGISPDVVRNTLQQPVKALILLSYGVGNAPQTHALLSQFKEATQNGVIIVNCTQCSTGTVNMDGYATGKALQDVGIVSGGDMTLEATLTKLHYILSQSLSYSQSVKLVSTDLRGELTPLN